MKKHILFSLAALMLVLSQVGADQPKPEEARGLPNISPTTSGKWDVFADGLAWFASEEASAVWADVINVGDDTSSFGAQDFDFDWDYGFRVGAGYSLPHDQWDTQLYWTWFRTEAKQSSDPGTIHPEFFAADLTGNLSHSANIRWSLLFNMFDWELGRNFWVSKDLLLRPFMGLKGGTIYQAIHVQYDNLIVGGVSTGLSAKERVKNNFWGVGPIGGLNTKWRLRNFGTHFPSLFGDFSVATMWGTWSCADVYNDTSGKKFIVYTRNSALGALMLRGFMGLGWDAQFNKGKSHFATQLGFETQLWMDQLRVATSQLVRLHGDLTLQGVTLNCRFNF